MPNFTPPKQRWHVRIVLKSGAIFDSITEMEPNKIDAELAAENPSRIEGLDQHDWPVFVRCYKEQVASWIITPHEVYLAGRPAILS